MRFAGTVICCFSLVLLLLLGGILFLFQNDQTESVIEEIPLSFLISTEAGEELIQCWQNDQGCAYVFLPAYAEMEYVYAIPGSQEISIDGISVADGMNCADFSLNEEYILSMNRNGIKQEETLIFVRSGNIPAVYMDVQSGGMEYIHQDISNREPGSIAIYGEQGEMLYSGKLDTVKGRGNTSWYAEKKPYNIALSEEADLLGMGKAKNWILISDGYNPVNIRNKIVYDFSKKAGLSFTPDSRWIDLYLNGEYAGLYLLTERNEVHENRVNISKEGSFLVSMEDMGDMDRKNTPYLDIGSSQVLRVRYSDMSNQELREYWISLRNALTSENGVDPDTGKHWRDMIDLDSWVRKYLIEEVFGNPDGGAVSQFFYLDGSNPQNLICAGPVWDYDFAMGGEGFWMREYDSFLTMAREYSDDGMYLPWFYELYKKDTFYVRLTEIFQNEFLPLMDDLIETELEKHVEQIRMSVPSDSIRWGYSEEEITGDLDCIKDFLTNRVEFLSDMWLNDTVYHIVHLRFGESASGYIAVKDGETLPGIPEAYVLGGLGWFNHSTGLEFDIEQQIYGDTDIYLKEKESDIPLIHYVPVISMMLILLVMLLPDVCNMRKKQGRQV